MRIRTCGDTLDGARAGQLIAVSSIDGATLLRDIYIRPIGLIPFRQTETATEAWDTLQLAGGWLSFTSIESIERNGAAVDKRIVGMGGFMERDWGRRTLTASDLFERLRLPRPRICGLALDRPRIMGIVNVTPDSFSDGGKAFSTAAAVAHALSLVEQGADILDIGGESTRPGAEPTPIEEEVRRIVPVIEAIADKTDALISVDTRKPEVMKRAVAAGADIVNDVTALTFEPDSLETAADLGVPIVLMHAQGDPRTMQRDPVYANVVLDVFDYLEDRIEACRNAGIPRERLVIDPGIGFGKTLEHNLALIERLATFHGLGVPLLLGASRKNMIGRLTGVTVPAERVHGSMGAAIAAVAQGAQVVRVHDVGATKHAMDVFLASIGATPSS